MTVAGVKRRLARTHFVMGHRSHASRAPQPTQATSSSRLVAGLTASNTELESTGGRSRLNLSGLWQVHLAACLCALLVRKPDFQTVG